MSPRSLTVVHRPAAEIDGLLLRHLHASRGAVSAVGARDAHRLRRGALPPAPRAPGARGQRAPLESESGALWASP